MGTPMMVVMVILWGILVNNVGKCLICCHICFFWYYKCRFIEVLTIYT